jgi:two-component system, NtrC family, sensor kinase
VGRLGSNGLSMSSAPVVVTSDEAQLSARRAGAEHAASVGSLSAVVAHEINNPLACILANLGFLRTELSRGSFTQTRVAELQSALSEALAAAERIGRVTTKLEQVSGPDSSIGSCELATVVASAVDCAHLDGVQVRCDVPPMVVRCGEVRLGEALWVILRTRGGVLARSAHLPRDLRISATRKGDFACIELTDAGAPTELLASDSLLRDVGGRISAAGSARGSCVQVLVPLLVD